MRDAYSEVTGAYARERSIARINAQIREVIGPLSAKSLLKTTLASHPAH